MAHVFGSSWMALLLVSVTVMLLQSQAVEGNGCWYWLTSCFRPQEEPDHTISGVSDLKEKVIAECKKIVSQGSTRCDNFWNHFTAAFINKDPVTVGLEAYKPLIDSEPIPVKTGVLLWSKTSDMINWLSEQDIKHYFHIGETIYGSMNVQNAVWCGRSGSRDVLTSGCPDYKKHAKNPVSSYWKSVSTAFAEAATGVVTVLLSGAVEEPFNAKSIFATDELPNLQSGKVTALHVILVNKGSSQKNCGDASLTSLQSKWPGTYACRTAKDSELKAAGPENWWQTAKPSQDAVG